MKSATIGCAFLLSSLQHHAQVSKRKGMAMKQDSYRFYAGIYDRLYEPAEKRLRKIGLELFPPCENLAILDVGCGTGTQLALYQRAGCKLTGIDLSTSMLAVAKQKLGESAELRQEDATQMSFDSGTFDLVSVVLVLHEMPAELRPGVLQECRRVLKASGRILLIDYHIGPHPFPMGWVWKLMVTLMEMSAGREHYANYRDFISRQGLETLVSGGNFTVDRRFIVKSGVGAVYLLKS
jgi:demethylmenaquinone methyltransferase/2-methoxy-6-polyprenyl-1,4-benzoquinol methylase